MIQSVFSDPVLQVQSSQGRMSPHTPCLKSVTHLHLAMCKMLPKPMFLLFNRAWNSNPVSLGFVLYVLGLEEGEFSCLYFYFKGHFSYFK